ncbi:spore maturation protein [Hespellia stercorisuis]|uniref:Spore maturation protein B n=1 Tax=Hespellia stercorisuis DSM 15480 TaxID=1121950 RepID=A0A1M6SQF9_9FIRM|nr:nucleoside recognition domain-containing protein [Hespellia stercorisuis]SHK46870.1 spore maturation protein B [Hespellia stercorisuis DSM 15480]
MNLFLSFFDLITPVLIFLIILFGLHSGVNVYEAFIRGAKDGLHTVLKIMPTLIGLMIAVGVLRSSGFLDIVSNVVGRFSALFHFPGELVPLAIVKMFSSSAATGLLLDIFRTFGPDSRLGIIASIMLSCTETIFYTMSVYFMSAKVTRTRWTLPGALLATSAALVASVICSGLVR